MKIQKIKKSDKAPNPIKMDILRLAMSLMFMTLVAIYTHINYGYISLTLVIAALIGGYMAINIGANDVANNIGPAVGSKAMTMTTAIFIAAIFEASGAIIAGADVINTIKGGIISSDSIEDINIFIWLMMAALLASAIWINLATVIGAPVSTSHALIGGIIGSGTAAAGWHVINWSMLGQIGLSWVISPLMGAIIAASLLYLIKRTITYKKDMMEASRRIVPLLLAVMGWAFATYLIIKGLKHVWEVSFLIASLIGMAIATLVYFITKPMINNASKSQTNTKEGVNRLFNIPLIFAAAILSFGHGSNDVSNAVGPLAAIYEALAQPEAASAVATVPLWILLLGAIGIALGLTLYGPKMVKTVGTEITDIDQMRAFSIALAAALTVILASQLGMPISTTHVAIGAIFGVGFLREYLKANYQRIIHKIEKHYEGKDRARVEAFLSRFEKASIEAKGRMLKRIKRKGIDDKTKLSKKEHKRLKKVYKQELVKRSIMMKVIATWLITVPATAVLAAISYYAIRGYMI